ncbi:MAG: (2Fe-2S)-binding protein [Bdellovibrionales bacterium]|nr:(2Fe-2S)-binding protein [Bdellovibrionales bacterium]
MEYTIKVFIPGADELTLKIEKDTQGLVVSAGLQGIGGPELLTLMQEWRPHLVDRINKSILPEGNSSGEMMLRELILRSRSQWNPPQIEEELCHCRFVKRDRVDQSILLGAHTPEKISLWTTASTACGSCRKDVIELLQYRLQKPA